MLHIQGVSKDVCSLVAVVGREISEKKDVSDGPSKHPYLEPVTSRFLEVHTLSNPSEDEFCRALDSYRPTLVCLQGDQFKDRIGTLVLGGRDYETSEAMAALFSSALPVMVYLEMSNGEKLAEALYSKGVPYVIYWKKSTPRFGASHFLSAFLSVLRSSCAHAWDAFQLAQASYRLYGQQKSRVFSDEKKSNIDFGPRLLGNPPQIDISIPDVDMEDEEGNSLNNLPAIQIHDDGTSLRFLICGAPDSLDTQLLRSLEDGLNALLSIEIRGSKILGKFRYVALQDSSSSLSICMLCYTLEGGPCYDAMLMTHLPKVLVMDETNNGLRALLRELSDLFSRSALVPLQTEAVSRDVVSMRCDIATSSYAHISILLSGNAQTCFDDQLLEKHIKKDIIEKSQLVQKLTSDEENKPPVSEPRLSASVACGAKVFEVSMKVPMWAAQVLRQLALDSSHRGLVALGIASIQGLAVASFDKDDAERMLALSSEESKDDFLDNFCPNGAPVWLRPPPSSRQRFEQLQTSPGHHNEHALANGTTAGGKYDDGKDGENSDWVGMPLVPARQRFKVAALRPVPRIRQHKIHYLAETSGRDIYNDGQFKDNIAVAPVKPKFVRPSSAYKKSSSRNLQARQIISLNPLPLKKHGCNRNPIQICSEEEFLKDVMHFLSLRGHTRLIPPGGLTDFPDAILNAKRLDLFNLYKEVVSRGGFHVGNGINWKGQVFSKMSNYTMTHRMTGVGNTLKRHYETYLLEYEMAHDDVDGECCLLCHSGAAGDWVNCGMCGEWAHFGCDRRQGLGAFKDYAKTDGLEYICPPCSNTSSKKKQLKISNGFP